jgi:hypothetical protein
LAEAIFSARSRLPFARMVAPQEPVAGGPTALHLEGTTMKGRGLPVHRAHGGCSCLWC